MTQHSDHHKEHSHSKSHSQEKSGLAQHGPWFVAAVVLMLVGIAIYVFTMDESIQPDGDEEPMPAAVGE
jgi:hypothetical protein